MKFSFKLLKKVKNQAGATAVIVAITLPMLIGFGALAVDVGYMLVAKNELQNVADAAALAGARFLGSTYETLSNDEQQTYEFSRSDIVNVVQEVARKNQAAKMNIEINAPYADFDNPEADVRIGTWNSETDELDPMMLTQTFSLPDAVKVIARRDDTANGPILTFFARIFNIDTASVVADATAALTGPSKVEEGELKTPFAISENTLALCTEKIEFSPTNTSCSAWHNFLDPVSAEDMKTKLIGLIQGDEQEYPVFDEDKNPVFENWVWIPVLDEFGVQELDESGNPEFEGWDWVPVLDEFGITVFEGGVQVLDGDWNPVFEEGVPVFDEDWNQVFEGGVQVFDEGGNPVLEKHVTLVNGPEWLSKNFTILDNKTPDPLVTPEVASGVSFEFIGGVAATIFIGGILGNKDNDLNLPEEIIGQSNDPAPFPALFDYFRRRDDDGNDEIWTATIPVYKDDDPCDNPNDSREIVNFLRIEVHMPFLPAPGEDEPEDYDWKTVDVYIDCETSFLPGRGGGAVSNIRGTIPNLVE